MLIAAKLPRINNKARPFPWILPDTPMGAFSLLDEHTLIGSAACSSPFPAGIIAFQEDRQGPPSRAYLKLWEAFVRARAWPQPGDFCFEAGASPGGWTWALAKLGASVLAVDRAPLEPGVAAMPGVNFREHDAFTIKPEEIAAEAGSHKLWLLSDVACYPARLYDWVTRMLASPLGKANFICTIKMQHEGDMETVRKFAAIPGGQVLHLYHNKHELTWIRIASSNSESKPTNGWGLSWKSPRSGLGGA